MIALEDMLSISVQEDGKGSPAFFFKQMHINSLVSTMRDRYTSEDIVYSIVQLSESDYIVTRKDVSVRDSSDRIAPVILYITPKGHEFLASMHDKETWKKKISPILGAIGNVSLSIIESVSKGIANAAIDKLILNSAEDTT